VIGECMLELSASNDGAGMSKEMTLSYGGDTLNTAIYLSRLGLQVNYITALGDDDYSDWMIEQWKMEGVCCEQVMQLANNLPGLYMIKTDDVGERQFSYWRSDSPARKLFNDEKQCQLLFKQLIAYDWIYLSGITLSLFSSPVRIQFFEFLSDFRTLGGKVAFDSNYRALGWPSITEAQRDISTMNQHTDIALSTLEDELLLFGDSDEYAVITRLHRLGVTEVAIKMGADGCLVSENNRKLLVKSQHVENIIDTTAAGDSFNGAYLAQRINKVFAVAAAEYGHRLAAKVIQFHGAIIPQNVMVDMLISRPIKICE